MPSLRMRSSKPLGYELHDAVPYIMKLFENTDIVVVHAVKKSGRTHLIQLVDRAAAALGWTGTIKDHDLYLRTPIGSAKALYVGLYLAGTIPNILLAHEDRLVDHIGRGREVLESHPILMRRALEGRGLPPDDPTRYTEWLAEQMTYMASQMEPQREPEDVLDDWSDRVFPSSWPLFCSHVINNSTYGLPVVRDAAEWLSARRLLRLSLAAPREEDVDQAMDDFIAGRHDRPRALLYHQIACTLSYDHTDTQLMGTHMLAQTSPPSLMHTFHVWWELVELGRRYPNAPPRLFAMANTALCLVTIHDQRRSDRFAHFRQVRALSCTFAIGCTITGDWSGADLRDAIFPPDTNFSHVLFSGTNLQGITAEDTEWSNVSVDAHSDMRYCRLRGTAFIMCSFKGTAMRSADMRRCTFIGCDVTGASWTSAKLGGASISTTNVEDLAEPPCR